MPAGGSPYWVPRLKPLLEVGLNKGVEVKVVGEWGCSIVVCGSEFRNEWQEVAVSGVVVGGWKGCRRLRKQE